MRTLPVFPRSTWSSVQNKAPWDAPSQARGEPSSPRFRHSHSQYPSCQVSALSFPEELMEQQKPDSVTRKDGGAGLPGVNRSDRSHFPVSPRLPPPSLTLSFLLAATAAPPRGRPRRSPVAAGQAPAQRRSACVSTPGLGGPPGPSCLLCPSLSSLLGAEVSGPRSRGSGPHPVPQV